MPRIWVEIKPEMKTFSHNNRRAVNAKSPNAIKQERTPAERQRKKTPRNLLIAQSVSQSVLCVLGGVS